MSIPERPCARVRDLVSQGQLGVGDMVDEGSGEPLIFLGLTDAPLPASHRMSQDAVFYCSAGLTKLYDGAFVSVVLRAVS